jgi:hypothetical protein
VTRALDRANEHNSWENTSQFCPAHLCPFPQAC